MSFLTSKISRNKLNGLISQYSTDKLVLEIGAYGKPSYTKFFPNRIGLDIKSGPGVDVVGSVYKIPFEENKFEVVLCISVLEHLENPKLAIDEIRRVTKSNGIVIVSVPFIFPLHDVPGDYWRFTKFGLKHLFRDGWDILELKAESNIFETFAVLLQRLGYQTEMRLNKLMKIFVFLLARVLEKMPNIFKEIYGDINRKFKEPEAFASGFFLVARKK